MSAATIGGAVTLGCLAFSSDAEAACIQSGNTVNCADIDDDGFRSRQSLIVRILPDAFIRNQYSPERVGNCPLSFPSIEVGASSNVLNEGLISTFGVCAFGISVDRNSLVVNRGSILTHDIVAFGVIADAGGTVRNSGIIRTAEQGSGGIFAGANMSIFNESGGTITTTGVGSSAIEAGAGTSVINNGGIVTRADASLGIDVGAGSVVVNTGSIETRANNSIGVRIAGGNLINSGKIRSVLEVPGFALFPTMGVSMAGSSVSFTNMASGIVEATHIGVRLSGAQESNLSNAGSIEVTRASYYDGVPYEGGAAILLSGATGVEITNSGTIVAHGIPAIQSTAPRVSLSNSGTITGDVFFGGGSDTVIYFEGSAINGTLDLGDGEDNVIVDGRGTLANPIVSAEFLTKRGPGDLTLARDQRFSQTVIFGGGGIVLPTDVRLISGSIENLGSVRGAGIAEGSLTNIGRIAPGTATTKGTLTITNAFRQLESGTLAIRLSPDGSSDKLVVGGPAALGGTLALTYDMRQGTVFQDGQRFDIVVPLAGSLTTSGRFTLAAPQLTFTKANLVTSPSGGLAVEMERLSYASVGVTENQRSIGRVLDAQAGRSAALSPAISALEAATPENATGILESLTAESPGGLQTLGVMALERFTQGLQRRLPMETPEGRTVWARGFSAGGHSRGIAPTADYDLHGVMTGVDLSAGEARLGIAAARTDGDYARGRSHADLGTTFVAVTAYRRWSDIALDAALAYGTGSPTVSRTRTINGAPETLTAEAKQNLWSVATKASYSTALRLLAIEPHIGMSYHHASLSSVDERVALGVRTEDAVSESLRTRVGAKISGAVDRVRPYGDLSVSVELLQTLPSVPASLIGASGTAFMLTGDRRRRMAVEAEAGLAITLAEGLEAYIAGAMTANDLLAGRTLTGGLTFRW